jgi:hypothetical protein
MILVSEPIFCSHCAARGDALIKEFATVEVSPGNLLNLHVVSCTHCGASGGARETLAEAIAAWNQRAYTPH